MKKKYCLFTFSNFSFLHEYLRKIISIYMYINTSLSIYNALKTFEEFKRNAHLCAAVTSKRTLNHDMD